MVVVSEKDLDQLLEEEKTKSESNQRNFLNMSQPKQSEKVIRKHMKTKWKSKGRKWEKEEKNLR